MEKNYYQILQIDKDASPEIIEKAYKTLAKKYHPDLQPENEKNNAEKTLQKINEAYETLSNPVKRNEYNLKLLEQTRLNEEKKIIQKNSYNHNINNKKFNYNNYQIKKSKKTLYDYLLNIISIFITIIILLILWQLPFIKNIFKDNLLIKVIESLFY